MITHPYRLRASIPRPLVFLGHPSEDDGTNVTTQFRWKRCKNVEIVVTGARVVEVARWILTDDLPNLSVL